jgi:hypothetical protein
MLSHERLDVSKLSIEFLAAALRVLGCRPSDSRNRAKALLVRVVAMLSRMA